MIIWIASYPKSGNTWIRSFIYSLIYSKDLKPDLKKINIIDQYPVRKYFKDYTTDFNNFKLVSKYWDISQSQLGKDKKVKFLKTHHINCKIENNSFIQTKNTSGVIHIVRDPRNVITSIKNHYSKKNYDEAFDFLSDPLHCIDVENLTHQNIDKKLILNTLISSWSNHYNSWKNASQNYLLLKYEDLEKHPFETFTKLVDFLEPLLKIKINKTKLNKIIELNNFENLKKIEENSGFDEAAISKEREKVKFFNLGPMNQWQKFLPKDIRLKIEKNFEKEMKELNYL